jgi:hypothetical protein
VIASGTMKQMFKKNKGTNKIEYLDTWEMRDLANIFPIILRDVYNIKHDCLNLDSSYHNLVRIFDPYFCDLCSTDNSLNNTINPFEAKSEIDMNIESGETKGKESSVAHCPHRFFIYGTQGLVKELKGSVELIQYLNDKNSLHRNIHCLLIANITSVILFGDNKYKVTITPDIVIIFDESIEAVAREQIYKRLVDEHNNEMMNRNNDENDAKEEQSNDGGDSKRLKVDIDEIPSNGIYNL